MRPNGTSLVGWLIEHMHKLRSAHGLIRKWIVAAQVFSVLEYLAKSGSYSCQCVKLGMYSPWHLEKKTVIHYSDDGAGIHVTGCYTLVEDAP